MRKIGILLLTCVLLLSLTACGAKNNGSEDAIVVEVGGVSVKKSEALDIYSAVLTQTLSMYEQLGFPLDETNPEFITSMKTDALNVIGEQLAMEQELKKLNIGLTDQDRKTIDETAQSEYNAMIEQYAAYNQISKEDTEKLAKEAGYTFNYLSFSRRSQEVQNRLMAHYGADIAVSEDEILERYDALIEEQKETYASNPSQYTTDFFNDEMIVVRPEGYRYIKNIVIEMPDDIMTQLEAKDSELYDVMYYLYYIETEINAGELEESRKTELETQKASLQADYDRLNQEISTLMNTGLDQIRSKAEEVLALCKAEGADFDAIMQEYSADKPTGDLLTKGYPVSADTTSYVASFTEASMALQNIGDISELVESAYGFHILLYNGDIASGVIPLDELKAEISDLLLTEKQQEALSQAIQKITESANIRIYIDRF